MLGFVYIVLGALALVGQIVAAPQTTPWQPVQVTSVLDGDTFAVATGDRVRLLDINTPEVAHEATPAEPYGREATQALKNLVQGRTVWLQQGKQMRDTYGRLLAHVFVPNTTGGWDWVNGTLVKNGAAVVYTFAESTMFADELLAYETTARAAQRGLWALPRWQVHAANSCCAPEFVGLFGVVAGKIVSSGQSAEALYLNFGPDYRTDFTIQINRKDLRWFAPKGKKRAAVKAVLATYVGKNVRVRGVLRPHNGVSVKVTHPAQLEVLD